ncbi:MAG: DUF2298 domain-containing protein [Anaerolineae bacterium]
MLDALLWWLVLALFGLLALPITLRLLRFLPERGLVFSRPISLLLVGYAFWLLVSLGLLQNNRASLIAVLLALAVTSAVVWQHHHSELLAALRRLKRALLVGELFFLLAFAGFCLFRAYSPDIAATEKPMEFGFINAILRSSSFPPNDPWLAGYSISYYYLGYVLVAILTRLSGINSAVAFNLTQASLFAMTITGAYGVVLNLVLVSRARRLDALDQLERRDWRAGILHGLSGGIFVALLGNLEGVFEFIRARGWGSPALWRFLDITNLQATPVSRTWYPDDSWWWWRATRLIHDRDLNGVTQEVISEFPFFSFLLGDNHPHVLALPFVLMTIGLAFNVLLGWFAARRAPQNQEQPAVGIRGYLVQLWPGGALELLLYGLLLGSLIFLNTWDYPIYLALFVLAVLVGRLGAARARLGAWLSWGIQTGALLLGLGLLFYLPFLVSFRSQAGGIGLVHVKTQLQQFALMFGPYLAIIFAALVGSLNQVQLAWSALRSVSPWVKGSGIAAAAFTLLFIILGWYVAALMMLGIGAVLVLLFNTQAPPADEPQALPDASALMLQLMLLIGFGLVLAVEFVFLRDIFGTRMNTVFKFYYQAWVLFGLAAAVGMYYLLERTRVAAGLHKALRITGISCLVLLLAGGALYTVMAVPSRDNSFKGSPTLDGTAYLKSSNTADYGAIAWLQAHAPLGAVLVEAPGDSYSEYDRISAYSGVPTLLGWGGHELQWRGNYDIPAAREPDIEAIYASLNISQTRELLAKYNVTYVILGPRERSKYSLTLIIFAWPG